MLFFSLVAGLLATLALALALPIVRDYLATGLVPRMPTALLCTGVMLAALLAGGCGVILQSVKQGQREIKRLLYLQQGR